MASNNDVLVPDELLELLTQLETDAPAAAPVSSALGAHKLLHRSASADSSADGEMSGSARADPLAFDAAPLCVSDDERALLLAILSDSNSSTASAQTTAVSAGSHASGNESISAASGAQTEASEASATAAAPHAAAHRPASTVQHKPRRIRKPRPNRKRRKHEVDALRIRVAELTEVLRRLQLSSHAVVESSARPHQRLLPATETPSAVGSSSSSSVWQIISSFERDEARAAVTENARLRALYCHQLDVLQRLHAMYQSQFDLTALGIASPPPLAQQLRLDPFDDDFALFASLGRAFDAQFAGIEADLEATGLLHFDGTRAPRLVPKRAGRGWQELYLETSHSRVLDHDLFTMEEAIVATSQSPVLFQIHKLYEVRAATETISFLKVVDDMVLPTGAATLTTRIAIKRFPGPHRMVGVWDAVIDVSGGVSLRMREQGWNALRPPLSRGPEDAMQPRTIEQSVTRYYPIDARVQTERDLCAGSLHYVLVTSYRRHLEVMHQITDSILRSQAL